jgi:hypothetical protein
LTRGGLEDVLGPGVGWGRVGGGQVVEDPAQAFDEGLRGRNPACPSPARASAAREEVGQNPVSGVKLAQKPLQERVEDSGGVEDGFEIRAKAHVQGEQAQEQGQQAVDGAHVEPGRVAQDQGQFPGGLGRAPDAFGVAGPGQGQGLEGLHHPGLHFRGRLVGEGDGQDARASYPAGPSGAWVRPHAAGGAASEADRSRSTKRSVRRWVLPEPPRP